MSILETQKLEIGNQLHLKYPGWINPSIISVKYCQTNTDAFLEMTFVQSPADPAILNLDFISGDEDEEEESGFALLFHPDADIIDNAAAFIELDPYSLINCVDGLFTKEAELIINDRFWGSRDK